MNSENIFTLRDELNKCKSKVEDLEKRLENRTSTNSIPQSSNSMTQSTNSGRPKFNPLFAGENPFANAKLKHVQEEEKNTSNNTKTETNPHMSQLTNRILNPNLRSTAKSNMNNMNNMSNNNMSNTGNSQLMNHPMFKKNQTGGSDYYSKYIKYKNKYLMLKKKLNI